MPRRRNPFNPRNPRRPRPNPFAGHAAPPPVVAATPTIDLPRLQLAYEWMTLDRLLGFKLVFEWYVANQVALLWQDPLNEERQKSFSRAMKAKQLGDSSNLEGEKIQAWSTAIHLFEKLWAHKAPNYPLLDKAMHVSHVSPYITQVQAALGNLNAAFGPAGCKFRVTFGVDREFLSGEILLPQAQVDAMIPMAPLVVILKEAPTVAKVLSIVTDADGNQKLDGALFMQKLPEVLEHVGGWAAGLGGAVNKPLGKAPRQPKAPKVQGGAAAAGNGAPSIRIKGSNVIHLTGALNHMGGKRLAVYNLVRDGMTVAQLQAEAEAKVGPGFRSRSLAVLKVMIEQGTATIS